MERKDLNLNQADTEYGQEPLSFAAKLGHEEVVKMLLKRNDVRSTLPDNRNRTPLSLAISEGHERIARILQEQGHPNSEIANHSRPESLPPFPEHECAAEMEVRYGGSSVHNVQKKFGE